MSVVVSMEEVGPWRQQLTIEVPASAVEAEIGRVVRHYAKSVRLPGFRKGKAPAKLVLNRFRSEIEREVHEQLVPKYWQEAKQERALDPLAPPRIERLTMEEGEPMSFVASVEVRPEIELRSYRDFELPEERTQPTDQEIGEAIDELRRQHGQWRDVDRGAARGDLVVGHLRRLDAGGTPGEASEVTEAEEAGEDEGQPIQVEVGDPRVWEELSLALTGLSAGQKTDFERREGEGEAAQTRRFEVEAREVKELELPELDDELAAKVGDFDSVEALRQAVAERIEATRSGQLRQRREQAMLDQLRERHPIPLPEGVVEKELEAMAGEYLEQLASQGVDVERVELDWERLAQDLKPQAERRVHARLLLDAVARAEELELEPGALEKLLTVLAQRRRTSVAALHRQLVEAGRLEALEAQLLRDQTVRYLLGEVPEASNDDASDETSEDT